MAFSNFSIFYLCQYGLLCKSVTSCTVVFIGITISPLKLEARKPNKHVKQATMLVSVAVCTQYQNEIEATKIYQLLYAIILLLTG